MTHWHSDSSLIQVTFESAAGLLAMMKALNVDLNFRFKIYVRGWNGVMQFPGYQVRVIPDVKNLVRLVG
jgi:hypothetical protein